MDTLLEHIEATWLALKPNMKWIAVFGLVTHPLYLVINRILENGGDSIVLRLLAVLACLLAIFLPRIEQIRGVRFASCLAVGLIFFALPFFFLWVLIQNSIAPEIGENELASRQIQCAFAMMGTALLIYDRLVLSLGLFVCIISVGILYLLSYDAGQFPSLRSGVFTQVPFWIFGIVAGTYFNRNRAMVEIEKFKTLSDTGSYLAHELRTPLAGVSIKLQGIKRLVQKQMTNAGTSSDDSILGDNENLESASRFSDAAIEDLVYANELIDMFLVRSGVTRSSIETNVDFKMSDCVREAIDRYPFGSSRERGRTTFVVDSDFIVNGTYRLMLHVVLNLVKNALTSAVSSHDPKVTIRIASSRRVGTVDVIDNGPGVPKRNRNKIFESFYTTTHAGEGTGVGLHFCKNVISEMGGSLTLHSIPNVETKFRIQLSVDE